MAVKLYLHKIFLIIIFSHFLTGFSNGFNEITDFDPISVSGINFAFDTYKRLTNSTKENVFFSPLSVSIALTTLLQGAKGQTFNDIKNLLQYDIQNSTENINKAISRHIKTLRSSKNDCIVNFANRLYIQKNVSLNPDFRQIFNKYYKGGLKTIDFVKSPTKAKNNINKWISKKTKGKISELFKELDSSTRFVLANAIYFKGIWNTKFLKNTKDENFTTDNRQILQTPMMTISSSKFNYAEIQDLNCQIIELPYKGFGYSMIILLPNRVDGLGDLEKHLNYTTFKHIQSKMYHTFILELKIPKFKIVKNYDLIPTFKSMGCTAPFDENADFSKMTGKSPIKISNIVHQSLVEVNEEGTEAAAATGIVASVRTRLIKTNIKVIADHPFLFLIWNKKIDNILFIGRFVNPKD